MASSFSLGHARPLQHARALHLGRRRHHHHRIDPLVAAGLEQQRDIEHHDRRAVARASARNCRSASRTSGCTIASSCFSAAGSPSTRAPSLTRSTLPSAVVPGNAASISGDRLALIEPVHGRIGVVHRHALLREQARGGRLAHADRAGQAEDEHGPSLIRQQRLRAAGNASSGNSGRPRMVKWSPSIRSNSWMPSLLDLIGADAGGHRVAGGVEIALEEIVRERRASSAAPPRNARTATSPSRTIATAECSAWVCAAQRHELLARRGAVGRLGEAPLARAPASGRRRAPAGPAVAPTPRAPSRAPAAPRPRRDRRAPALRFDAALVDIGRHDLDRNAGASQQRAPRPRSSRPAPAARRQARAPWVTPPAAAGARPEASAPPRRFPRSSGASRRCSGQLCLAQSLRENAISSATALRSIYWSSS